MLKTYNIYHVRPNAPEQFALVVVAVSAKSARNKLRRNKFILLPNGYYVIRNAQDAGDELSFENTITYHAQVIVPESVCSLLDMYLNATTEDEFQAEDNTLSYTAIFPDGVQMDVKCCGAQDEASWTEAVLFNSAGCEIGCSDPEDEFFGVWELEENGVKYVVEVVREAKK